LAVSRQPADCHQPRDGVHLGGRSHGKPGAATEKAPITIAVERLPSGRLGRARLQLAEVPNGVDQLAFARDVIAPSTEIHTDGAWVLTRLSDHGFTHRRTPGYLATDLDAVMPGPHLVSSLLKRWAASTLHHRISHQQLPYHLDEFTFRFNRRTSRAQGCCSTVCFSRPPARTHIPSASSSAAPATTGMNPQTIKPQLHSSGYAGPTFTLEETTDIV
jgi:ISXO2 transposase-like protein